MFKNPTDVGANLQSAYGQLNPLGTTAINLMANKNLETGATIDKLMKKQHRSFPSASAAGEEALSSLGGFVGRQLVKGYKNIQKGEPAGDQVLNMLQAALSPLGSPMPESKK